MQMITHFVEQSARFLLETSVIDKIEDQLINGSGTSNEMFSLATYSAEFDDTFRRNAINGFN